MLRWLFARRYLFSRKSHSVVNIIACVSTFAVAIPVAAMIILLSVFNGFERMVRSLSLSFDADITATAAEGGSFAIDDVDLHALELTEGVLVVSLTAEQEVMAAYGGRRVTVCLKGIDDNYRDVTSLPVTICDGLEHVRIGSRDFALLGKGVAYALGIRSRGEIDIDCGDIEIYALNRNSFSSVLPLGNYRRREIPVGGIFEVDAQTDSRYVLTSLRAAQQLFGYEGRATAIEILALDDDPSVVAPRVAAVLGDAFSVRTREEKNATVYGIMRAEKWAIFFISLLVLVVASFSIVGTLAMLIIEKRGDMRTLSAMGADRRFIRSIFMGEGTLVCGAGTAAGLLLGIAACAVQQRYGLITIPAETFLVDVYPVDMRLTDILAVVAAAALIARGVCRMTVTAMIR